MEKNIWLWWEQGWEQAPAICRYNYLSFKKTSPDWDIHLVDKNNIYQYIPKTYSWLFQCQGPAFRADIIRSLLLFYHGGVYSDAACMNFKNLDETMNMVNFDDFFTLKLNHFRATTREAVSWFLIAPKGSKVFGKLAQTFVAAAKKNPIQHEYFMFHFTYDKLIKSDPLVQKHFESMYSVNGFNNRIDAQYLKHTPEKVEEMIPDKFPDPNAHPRNIIQQAKDGNFVHLKLRHRGCEGFENENSLYNNLRNIVGF